MNEQAESLNRHFLPTMDGEIEAMGLIVTAMEHLTSGARKRVMRWAMDRYGHGGGAVLADWERELLT